MSSSDSDFGDYFADPHQRLKNLKENLPQKNPINVSDEGAEFDIKIPEELVSKHATTNEPKKVKKTRGRKPKNVVSNTENELSPRISENVDISRPIASSINILFGSPIILSDDETRPNSRKTRASKRNTNVRLTRSRRRRMVTTSISPDEENAFFGQVSIIPNQSRNIKSRTNQPVESTIVLSDDEAESKSVPLARDLDKFINKKLYSVFVLWQSVGDKTFELDANDKFSSLFDYYAEQKGHPRDLIVFFMNENQLIKPTDTPSSLGISSGIVIDGGVTSKSYYKEIVAPKKNPFEIKLKIQCEHLKRPFFIAIDRNDDFNVLLNKCAEELKTPSDQLKLNFDGDPLILTSTPIIMDFTGGECLDLYFKKP